MVTQPLISGVLRPYQTWNDRLLEYALTNGVDADGRFFLIVRQMLEDEPDPHNAEEQFIASVREQYTELLNCRLSPVRWLRQRHGEREEPLCVALLGLSVLAAEQMNDNRYYEHLASLLGQSQEGSGVYAFDKQAYLAAWKGALATYLKRRYGYALLEPDAKGMTFVCWPRAHALLRSVDQHKLPHLFKAVGFAPTQAITRKSVENAVNRWHALSSHRPTDAGYRACADPVRRPGILLQVVRALEQWDGSVPTSGEGQGRGAKTRTEEARLVILDPGACRVRLRTKRPDGFPESLTLHGLHLIAPDKAAYYDDVEVPPSWSRIMTQGVQAASDGKRVIFRGAEAFALVRSEAGYTGYEGDSALRLGVPCGILCLTSRSAEAAAYLRRVCDAEARGRTLNASELPGWTLFDGFVPKRSAPVPPRLDALAVESKLLIRPIGGLRLGQERNWMQGSPPRAFEVWGANPPQELYVNGEPRRLRPAKLGEPWVLEHPFGDEVPPGAYSIVAGANAYHLLLVAPEVRVQKVEAPDPEEALREDCDGPAHDGGEQDDLQGARWKRIGRPDGAGEPCWAVGWSNGRAAVVALRQPLPAPSGRPLPDWSSSVLRAAHARVGVLESTRRAEQGLNDERRAALSAWRAYVAVAVREERRRQLRRRGKS